MRRIVVHMSVSLDGFFEWPDHDIGWHLVDDELHEYVDEQLATMSAFLFGRVTCGSAASRDVTTRPATAITRT